MIALISQQFEIPFVDCLARRERKREEREILSDLLRFFLASCGRAGGQEGREILAVDGRSGFLFAGEEGAIGLREILGSLVFQPRRRLSPPAQSQRRLNHASNHRRTYCGPLSGDGLGGNEGGVFGERLYEVGVFGRVIGAAAIRENLWVIVRSIFSSIPPAPHVIRSSVPHNSTIHDPG